MSTQSVDAMLTRSKNKVISFPAKCSGISTSRCSQSAPMYSYFSRGARTVSLSMT